MDEGELTAWRAEPVPMAALALAAFGLAISVYLTVAHYEDFTLACSVNSVIDCAAVTHSAYSLLPGTSLPVSAAGVAWFALMAALAGLRVRLGTAGLTVDRVRVVTAITATAGVLFVLYLMYVELVKVHRICEWCTAAHLTALGIFVLALLELQRIGED